MMELVYLHTFREVARWGSFTRAAEELGYAQSSVTTQIQKLEQSYGAVLFERFGRKMRLTHAGEVLLGYADQIIKLHAESKEVIANQTAGTISIGTIETLAAYYLPPYLQDFRAAYPHMDILLKPGNESALIQAVREGELDLAFLLDTPFRDAEITCVPLRKEPLVIIAKPDHRLASLSAVTVNDLAGETLITTEEGCTYRAMLVQALRESGVSFRLAYQFGNLEAIKQCVQYGLGIALLPAIAVQEEAEKGKLVAIPFQQPREAFFTQMIYHRKKWLSRSLRAFLERFESEGYPAAEWNRKTRGEEGGAV